MQWAVGTIAVRGCIGALPHAGAKGAGRSMHRSVPLARLSASSRCLAAQRWRVNSARIPRPHITRPHTVKEAATAEGLARATSSDGEKARDAGFGHRREQGARRLAEQRGAAVGICAEGEDHRVRTAAERCNGVSVCRVARPCCHELAAGEALPDDPPPDPASGANDQTFTGRATPVGPRPCSNHRRAERSARLRWPSPLWPPARRALRSRAGPWRTCPPPPAFQNVARTDRSASRPAANGLALRRHPAETGRACQWPRIWLRKARRRSLFGLPKNSAGGATSTTSPRSMNTTRSATVRAKPIS